MRPGIRHFFHAWGNFANTLVYQVFGNRVQFFYIDVLGLGAGTIGVIWSIFGLWNAVNDPLMGTLSDRTRTRMGRRIPYILFGAIPLGLSFFLLWTPPQGNPLLTALYFLVMVFIFDTIYSLLIMAYNALFPELAQDVATRSRLAMAREMLAIIALLLAFILAPILSEDPTIGFVGMGLIIGALTAIGYLLAVVGARERPIDPLEQKLSFAESLRITLGYPAFRWYLLANLMKEYVFLILAATLPFWRKYALGITAPSTVFGITLSPGDQEAIMLGLAFVLAIPFLFLWRVVTPHIGARRAWQIASILFLPGLIMMFFARDFYTGLAGTLLIAPGLAGYQMLPIVLLSDVLDLDLRATGQRREGIFFGINGAVVKLAFTVQGIFYALVFVSTGYQAGATVQSDAAVFGIRFLMGLSPAIAAVLLIAFLQFMKLPQPEPETPAVAPAAV
jgi:GPH family glycoside/pentoside/hexuronide:cation symporter